MSNVRLGITGDNLSIISSFNIKFSFISKLIQSEFHIFVFLLYILLQIGELNFLFLL